MKGKTLGIALLVIIAAGILYWLWTSEYTVRPVTTGEPTQNAETLKTKVYAALDGVAVTAPDRLEVSFALKKTTDANTGEIQYKADYINPVDENDIAFIVIAAGEHMAVFSQTGDTALVAIPFYINYGGTGSFLYTGLFSFNNGVLTYVDGSGIGDRVSVTSLTEDGKGKVTLNYKTRYSNEAMAATPTVPAFAVYTADSNSINPIVIGENTKIDTVSVSAPLPEATVGKKFTVTGQARGTWYFEASFPVKVTDGIGNVVGQGIAQAQGDWMTENHVPFTASVTVTSYTGPAYLILQKDNPSGEVVNDAFISVPITIQ
jgi:hypothetical protein